MTLGEQQGEVTQHQNYGFDRVQNDLDLCLIEMGLAQSHETELRSDLMWTTLIPLRCFMEVLCGK